MAASRKPDGWYRRIAPTNQGVYKKIGVPRRFLVPLVFGCLSLGGWFGHWVGGAAVFAAGLWVGRRMTERDERWWDILVDKAHAGVLRLRRNRGRRFAPYWDT